MGKFTWGDTVRVRADAPHMLRPGALASVYAVSEGESRRGEYFESFPPGTVYSVEFEDSSSVTLHEDHLEAASSGE